MSIEYKSPVPLHTLRKQNGLVEVNKKLNFHVENRSITVVTDALAHIVDYDGKNKFLETNNFDINDHEVIVIYQTIEDSEGNEHGIFCPRYPLLPVKNNDINIVNDIDSKLKDKNPFLLEFLKS